MTAPDLLPYLLQVNGALLLFCGLYYLVLRRLTFFRLNRALLLGALLWAPLYPLIDLAAWLGRPAPLPTELLLLTPDWPALAPAAAGPAAIDWLLVAYWLGVAAFGSRLLVQLLSLYRLHRRSRPATFGGAPFRAVPEPVAPFAFWRTVYLHPAQHPPQELPTILLHEQVHVREWHTVDVLLAQLSLLFYWFNPGGWLLRQALHENLEFQTDYQVLQTGLLDPKTYQYRLLHQTVRGSASALVSHFNFQLLKTRVAMMNKPRTARVQAARYLLLLPLAGVLALWSCEKKAYLPEPVSVSQNQAAAAGALYFVDGRLSSSDALTQLPPADIESVNVLKGHKFRPGFNEEAFRQDFGDVGERGVILILTKAHKDSEAVRAFNAKYGIEYQAAAPVDQQMAVRARNSDLSTASLAGRLLLVDGQETAPGTTSFAPGSVRSVYVLDAQRATEKYGEKGKNGAVLITTK